MPTLPGVENVNFAPIINNVVNGLGFVLLAVLIIGGMWFAMNRAQFKINATVIPLYGSGKDGVFSFGKPKKNKVKWIRNRTAWKSSSPLFNKIEREPFDSEYIYPGNRIWVFELNDQWMPGRINIEETEEELRAEINPVPYYIRNWQSLTHKKHAIEFAKQGFWEENKHFIITLGVVIFNLILCGTVIYFTYKFATAGTGEMRGLADAIRNVGNIPGSGVAPR